jgi:predicted small secreted protein
MHGVWAICVWDAFHMAFIGMICAIRRCPAAAGGLRLRGEKSVGNFLQRWCVWLTQHHRRFQMRLPFVLLPLLALFAVAACETVEGAGRDLQTAGETVTGEAQAAQSGM